MAYIAGNELQASLREMNAWHPNLPLLFVFSAQKPGPGGNVLGGTDAVRRVYDALFGVHKIGISDDSRAFYLQVGLGESPSHPYALRKPTTVYGRAFQRSIKDTFANNGFLVREGTSQYRLSADFVDKSREQLAIDTAVDLKPLLYFHYWDDVSLGDKVGDLWARFCEEFFVDSDPFDKIFTCTDLNEEVPVVDPVGAADPRPPYEVREIILPGLYGSGRIDIVFWKRFRSALVEELDELKWHGEKESLAASITSGLMNDQALFLLGPPGTGKTTIVRKALLPALRSAVGTEKHLRYFEYSITPETTHADLFGFQGLDGTWVHGPLAQHLLAPVENDLEDENRATEGDTEEKSLQEDGKQESDYGWESAPHLLFFDEANRVDIEGLLSPLQGAFDRMQRREDPGFVTLGRENFRVPSRVFRVFAGNSPLTDIGRKGQSRPLKRRLSVIIPPDPVEVALSTKARFWTLIEGLLKRTAALEDPEIVEPAIALRDSWASNPDYAEKLRAILQSLRALREVAVTIGLIESIVLRAASHHALGREAPLDAALVQSFAGLISGETARIEELTNVARDQRLMGFADCLTNHIAVAGDNPLELDPLL